MHSTFFLAKLPYPRQTIPEHLTKELPIYSSVAMMVKIGMPAQALMELPL